MALSKRGDKWLARFSHQANGKQKETAKRFRLKADAERWLREQEANVEAGNGYVAPSRLTVNQWLDRWLAGLVDVRDRTRTDAAEVVRRYWRPTLGGYRLEQVTTDMIRRELATLTEAGKAPRTVQQAHAVLRQALNAAVADRLLRVNPAVGQRMVPPQRFTERTVWNRDEVRRFLAATSEAPLGALWAVQLWTGLRPSETLALTWADLDLDSAHPQLRVMRTLYRPRGNRLMWRLEAPKTEKSRAPVPLLPQVVEALRRHRDRQAVEQVIAGEGYAGHGFVFAGPTGEPLTEYVVSKHWQRAIADLNAEAQCQADAEGAKPTLLPPMRLYDCRHTCATLLLEAGVAMRVVQEILRHSTMMLTANTYSHVRPGLAQQAMAQMAAFVGNRDG